MAQKPLQSTTADITDVTDETTSSEIATTQAAPMHLGEVTGDFSANDIRLPRLQLVQNVGILSETFHPGDVILGGDNFIAAKESPIDVIILNARQYWKEYLGGEKFDPDRRALTFSTEAEVAEAGGTTAWVNGVGPTYSKAMTLTLLIKQPKEIVCGLFGLDIDNEMYAIAVWDVDKTAYRRVGPQILTAKQVSLRARGLLSGRFQLSTKTEKINKNNIVVPVLRLIGFNPETVVKQINILFSDTPDQQPEG